MRYSRDDAEFERVATIDIETTHYKPKVGETVSIGIGVHERGTPADEAEYTMVHRDGGGEAALIRTGLAHLNESGADALVSYNGQGFDLDFLYDRSMILEESVGGPEIAPHIDLFEDRKPEADRMGKKWPKLEECLEAYGWTPATTHWGGSELTNIRFGEELGPAYLTALSDTDDERYDQLTEVIEHYLLTDLEANIAVYHGDIGVPFEPVHVGTSATFEA
ncbi:ribonuclease H-like domain-containing protein [Halomarina oriensis]|uniref:YprB ribonuclease H-like domain-containing protein n=1 Tax=Halomarina oriensis TaxID=671145 RepID=A0A6B0GEI0_9EURY|nr:ribonuclease H-like domain-containing protein [Halomarina oriensis]MWG33124.1 hypothetical protein [Halomarina oriensis]